ncbi:hypothetical protein OOZ19_00790 [Saccharopolyspora sp. NFXS83]|uniref:hypothetical protein n=1 Tax=Saccharopolyspora sp. NFXS83 TaxID=2993560 RepID=UPI00224AB28E|nr:hypothetical protein [Saccharopolyspora sp. NFXS83]MCX2728767.1 hypothetical protein [Saccharopolyspora sp. NFXS83]
MQAPDTPEDRADLWRLVDLVGLLVWSDDANGAGIRFQSDKQKQDLESTGELVSVFQLAQYIRGAGEWVEGTNRTREAGKDAMDLPAVAFNVATGMGDVTRRILGEIIGTEALLDAWIQTSGGNAISTFDAWSAEVRPLAFRLSMMCRGHGQGKSPKPWDKHA